MSPYRKPGLPLDHSYVERSLSRFLTAHSLRMCGGHEPPYACCPGYWCSIQEKCHKCGKTAECILAAGTTG